MMITTRSNFVSSPQRHLPPSELRFIGSLHLLSSWWFFTNPSEKNMPKSNWVHLPQFFGVKITNIWVAPTYRYMDVSENSGFSTQIIHFNRVFHYFHHPLGVSPSFIFLFFLFVTLDVPWKRWAFFSPGKKKLRAEREKVNDLLCNLRVVFSRGIFKGWERTFHLGWWFSHQPIWKKYADIKLDHFSQFFRVKITKYLSCHHLVIKIILDLLRALGTKLQNINIPSGSSLWFTMVSIRKNKQKQIQVESFNWIIIYLVG